MYGRERSAPVEVETVVAHLVRVRVRVRARARVETVVAHLAHLEE